MNTVPTRRVPSHGTPSRYKGARDGYFPPCRCRACTHAHSTACTRRALAHLAGTPPLYPGEPLRQHVQTLIDTGMSYDLIARRANVAAATISYLMRGLTQSCRRDRALRILAVTPGDFDAPAERPVLGSMRRIRALYAIGHNHETIGAAAGLAPSVISHIANGHHQIVRGTNAAAIHAAYRTLAWQTGTSSRARSRARAGGWAGPLAWDPSTIDDPSAQPDLTDVPDPDLNRNERAAQRRDEIWLLHTACISDEEIAARVGLGVSTVEAIRKELRTGKKRDRSAKTEQVAA